jgi:hypothetical protein
MVYVAAAAAWVATAAAVSFAIWMTGSAAPLWAMLIPALMSATSD